LKVLVLGAGGMLGHELVKHLTEFELLAPNRSEYSAFDSLDKFDLGEGDVVVNCIGAIPQKGYSPEDMTKLNTDFPRFLAKHKDLIFIQIATDCAFRGDLGNYKEQDNRDAQDPYGKSKVEGEVVAHNWIHLRSSIIGPELTSKKSLFEWVRNQPRSAKVFGYANHYWNGVTTKAFSKVVAGLIRHRFFQMGTHHLVPANQVTKYELVKMIASKTHRDDLEVISKIVEPLNRTLDTSQKAVNRHLWQLAGYRVIPTIKQMLDEL
jgi:dTDP-4-dehydrorhamnose reductase